MDKSKTILDKIRLLFKSEETEETPVVVSEVVAEVKLEETPVVVAEVVSEVVAEVKLEETPLEVKPEETPETPEETALTIEEEVAALIERVDILEGIIKELVPAEVPEEVPEEEMDKDKIIAELKSQLEDKPAATPIIEKNENADKKSSHFNTMSSIINAQRLEKYGVGY